MSTSSLKLLSALGLSLLIAGCGKGSDTDQGVSVPGSILPAGAYGGGFEYVEPTPGGASGGGTMPAEIAEHLWVLVLNGNVPDDPTEYNRVKTNGARVVYQRDSDLNCFDRFTPGSYIPAGNNLYQHGAAYYQGGDEFQVEYDDFYEGLQSEITVDGDTMSVTRMEDGNSIITVSYQRAVGEVWTNLQICQ